MEEDLTAYSEVLCAGRGYVGEEAAKDEEWIRAMYVWLNRVWSNPPENEWSLMGRNLTSAIKADLKKEQCIPYLNC